MKEPTSLACHTTKMPPFGFVKADETTTIAIAIGLTPGTN
jgi:hypothetical protein